MIPRIEQRSVSCKDRVIEYQLTRKKVKNINLRIKPDGSIFVSANPKVPADYMDDFVRRKQGYIIRALKRFEENRRRVPAAPRQYINGENFVILGKRFLLKIMEGEPKAVWTEGPYLCLMVKDETNAAQREKHINDWLKNLERETFERICRNLYPMLKEYGISYPQIKIRHMTSRWGSCRPDGGVITLNSRLIEAPERCIEYVVLHELTHFIHPNHSKNFYEFVAVRMPDWKERKRELEDAVKSC